MADRVIIVDIHRGRTRVPVSDLVQMKGRCAREHGQVGYVDFIVAEDDVDELREELNDVENLRVDSVLNSNLAFHLVSEISRGKIRTLEDAEVWYSRSFASYLKIDVNLYDVINQLESWKCLTKRGKMYFPTDFANISSQYYFHPSDINSWYENFLEIFESGCEENDCAIAWALSNVQKLRIVYDVSRCYEAVDEYKSQVSSNGLDYNKTVSTGLSWWVLLGGPTIREAKGAAIALKDDFGRIHKALLKINDSCNMGRREFFEDLAMRVYYKISQELVPLCKIEGVTKTLALELYNIHGVCCYEDIIEHSDSIRTYGSERLIKLMSELR